MNKINHKWHKEMLMGQWSNSLEIRTYISGFPCNAANWPSKLKSIIIIALWTFMLLKLHFMSLQLCCILGQNTFIIILILPLFAQEYQQTVGGEAWENSEEGRGGQYCYYSVPWDQYCWHARLRYSCMVAKMLQKLKLGWSIYLSLGVPVLARLATEKKLFATKKGYSKMQPTCK